MLLDSSRFSPAAKKLALIFHYQRKTLDRQKLGQILQLRAMQREGESACGKRDSECEIMLQTEENRAQD